MAIFQEKAQRFLHSTPFFRDLLDDDVNALLDIGTVCTYKKNKHLFFHGDPAETLFIILNGYVKIYSGTSDGEESIIALPTSGKTVGEASIFDGAIYPFSASALEPTEIFKIPASFIKQRAQESPSFMAKIVEIISEDLYEFQIEKEHLSIMTTSQRAACMLLRSSSHMTGKEGTFTLPYDKSLAATYLGMKPETFSRALKELKSFGVTVKGPEITIKDFSELATYPCCRCSYIEGKCRGDKRVL